MDIEAATTMPPNQRLVAAGRFTSRQRAAFLGQRSWQLLSAFAAGTDVATGAERLLAEILEAISNEGDDEVRRELGGYATECRYIVPGGAGSNSRRGRKET